MVTETMYTGNVPIPGAVYTYRVTAVYDEGESDPSNEWAIDAVVGVEEYVSNATQLYPNPATNAVSITSDFNMESVTVYNFAGQVVLTQKINNTTYRVNTSNFDAGIYLFQIQTEEGRIAKRIVIE
jgi:fibronectin type 3 domain-containing protein